MNGNFLQSLAQNVGNDIGHMFQPQQQQGQPLAPQPAYTYQDGSLHSTPGPRYIAPGTEGVNGMIFNNPYPQRMQVPLIGKVDGPNSLVYYHDPRTNSIGGQFGQDGKGNPAYSGVVGVGNGKPFGALNHNGQPTDPLSALRALLGF